MKFEDLLRRLGDFGLYQKILYVVLCLPAVSIAVQSISLVVFLFAVPEHRCTLLDFPNDTYTISNDVHRELVNSAIPWESDTDEYSQCTRYRNHDNGTPEFLNWNKTEPCNSWVYDESVFESTISQSLNLVCDRKSYASHAKVLNMAGQVIGVLVSGPLSDHFGRKTVIVVSMLLMNVLTLCLTWVTSFSVLVPLVITMTACSSTQYLTSFIYGLELVGESKRMWTGIFINLFWSAGNMIVALAAFLMREWRTRNLVLSIPAFIYLYLFFIPESPRWLMTKGHRTKAMKTLMTIAKINHAKISREEMCTVTCGDEGRSEGFWKLLKSPVLLKRLLIIFYNWMAVGMAFYGLSMNITNLSGNIYLNFFLFVLMEAGAYIMCLVLLNRVGRKWMLCVSMVSAGLACSLAFVPLLVTQTPSKWIINSLACLGNTCVSAGFASLYVFTAELLPTTSRNFGTGLSSMCCRVGSLVSPYINDLSLYVSGRYNKILPMLIFGVVSTLAGMLAFLLPETLNKTLPETVDDAEQMGTNYSQSRPDKQKMTEREDTVHTPI